MTGSGLVRLKAPLPASEPLPVKLDWFVMFRVPFTVRVLPWGTVRVLPAGMVTTAPMGMVIFSSRV